MEHMKSHIDNIHLTMFRDANEDVMAALLEALEKLFVSLQDASKLGPSKLKKDYVNMLDMGSEGLVSQASRAQKNLMQDMILEHMRHLQSAWSGADLAALVFASSGDAKELERNYGQHEERRPRHYDDNENDNEDDVVENDGSEFNSGRDDSSAEDTDSSDENYDPESDDGLPGPKRRRFS